MSAPPCDHEPAGFIHLRTPLLPFDALVDFGNGLGARAAAREGDLDAAVRADQRTLRGRLRDWMLDPTVREAIAVASSSLDERVEAWLADADAGRGADVELSLAKYLARMAGRATPFGLFAGCSLGSVGVATRLRLGARSTYRRRSEIDAGYAAVLAQALSNDPRLVQRVLVRPNPTLYAIAERLHYAAVEGAGFQLIVVERDPPLSAALAAARDGASLPEVARAVLAVEEGATDAEALEYSSDLVRQQILHAELQPPVTGPRPLDDMIAQLEPHPVDERELLRQARDALGRIDETPLGAGTGQYRRFAEALGPIAPPPPFGAIQVDLAKPVAEATVATDVLAELHAGTLLLQRLFRPRPRAELTELRFRFLERYENRQVPLVEVLDEESGIGFAWSFGGAADASPLLAGLGLAPRHATEARPSAAERWLLPKVARCLAAGQRELSIDAAELDAWERSQRLPAFEPLPDAYAVMATLAAESEEALAAGRYRLLHRGAGTQGASLLGRFCQRDDRLREHVLAYHEREESLHPDAIFAELVYQAGPRDGNVTRRPVLRAYEIPCLGRSGAPRDRQLPLTDLRVSVEGTRFVLRSERLGREIVPRQTTAVDVGSSRNFGIVRFLTLLQSQGGAGVVFNWGTLHELPFLPRVVSGRLVLATARWLLDPASLEELTRARGPADRFRAVDWLRSKLELPRWVGLRSQHDELLPVDLENVLSQDALIQAAKTKVVLNELFSSPDELVVRGPEGGFVHEIVVPFIRRASREGAAPPPAVRKIDGGPPRRDRSFVPGGEWFYAKLYGGSATADRLLCEGIASFVGGLLEEGVIDRWFFVRYTDPREHLRLRLHGDPAQLARAVAPAFHEAAQGWLDEGMIWRVQIDTYEREIERYAGLEAMLASEDLFFHDSNAVLSLLEGPDDPGRRWRLILLGVHRLLDDLGLSAEERQLMLEGTKSGLARELDAEGASVHRIGLKYRAERAAIEATLAAGHPAFDRRSEALAPVVERLRNAGAPIPRLAGHYVHMHVNRALRSAWRAHEFILCDFLARIYESERARRRSGKTR